MGFAISQYAKTVELPGHPGAATHGILTLSRQRGYFPGIGRLGPRRKKQDGRLEAVEIATDEDGRGCAQLVGGPCDGRLHPLDSDTVELQVIMEDGHQHLYRRTIFRREVDGRSIVVFEWVGRSYGLR